MKIERDEDTFSELKAMSEDIHLLSRNYNGEIIGIDYYTNLAVLSQEQLTELDQLWHKKVEICLKEKLASQWMVVQVMLLSLTAIYIAAITGGKLARVIAGVVAMIAMIAIIEDDRVRIAKRNLSDARRVYQRLSEFQSKFD